MSCGTPKVWSSKVVWAHAPGANLSLMSATPLVMSRGTPATIMRGSAVFSINATSGAFPARAAVSSLAEDSVPPPASVCLTWMLGWVSLNLATIWAVLGAQDQNVRSTGPGEWLS
jgi:hypothetical protein